MISQRQAAPSRYQHIISGLVQPLNHARHRNPLVSVTFSPTQETRSQSAIWMLCPLSLHFPYRFCFSSIPQDPSKHRLTIDFSFICCILCVSRHVWPAIPLCILSTFHQLHSSKNIFPHHALAKKMHSIRCTAYKAVLQLEKWHAYQHHARSVRCVRCDATTWLHTFSWKLM